MKTAAPEGGRRRLGAVIALGLLSACASQTASTVATTAAVPAPLAAPPGDLVCTVDGATVRPRTAHLLGLDVVHVGACGACSNGGDLAVYRRTRKTLTAQATTCAFRRLLFGDDDAQACLADIGFTKGCARCWQENIACTTAHCRDVCLASRLRGAANAHVDDDGTVVLDPCIACDEVQCGAAFASCAGANRRRAGIVSDIPRPADQVWGRRP